MFRQQSPAVVAIAIIPFSVMAIALCAGRILGDARSGDRRMVGAIVVEAMVWSLRARARFATEQTALELAANILEAARAQPWDKLNQTWAERQAVPSESAALLPEGKVLVTVGPVPSVVEARRIDVEVRWQGQADRPPPSVRLSTILSGRQAKAAEGQP